MTIKVSMLSGPYAGRTREVPPEISAEGLLGECLKNGWEWEVDYSAATESEAFEWGRQDLSCRIIRALRAGLPVKFQGKIWQLTDPENTREAMRVVGEIEDAISDSGRIVSLGSDDEHGVEVLDMGPVQ